MPCTLQAVQDCNVAAVVQAADKEYASWLAQALSRPAANADALVDFLIGATRPGLPLDPAFYGCMQQYRQVCWAAWKACHCNVAAWL